MSRKTADVVAVEDGRITDEALGLIQRKANDAARRVEDGSRTLDEILDGFQATLEGSNLDSGVWKTVDTGLYKSVESLRAALEESGTQISNWADDLLGKLELNKPRQTLDLVLKSPEDLGYPDGARFEQICQAGLDRGYELCPAELGPYLREQYTEQPNGEWLVMAMEPIKDSDGNLEVFSVRRGYDGFWLSAYSGRPGLFWYAEFSFVFVRRKPDVRDQTPDYVHRELEKARWPSGSAVHRDLPEGLGLN